MQYRIKHITNFRYSEPIRESVMELRMKPRSDTWQRCHEFNLELAPHVRTHTYTDYLANVVHHFDIPSMHDHMEVTVTALVELHTSGRAKPTVAADAWTQMDGLANEPDFWDWLQPSHYAQPTAPLLSLGKEMGIHRLEDPMETLNHLNTGLHNAIMYDRGSTSVDSPIDESIEKRRGVCQDFAHIFIALARQMGIPARYVSGYLFHREGDDDPTARDATHAWAEAFVPGAGWLGFDPSNLTTAVDRHIRVAVGRDYRDVPPNRGVYRGAAKEELSVHVDVEKAP